MFGSLGIFQALFSGFIAAITALLGTTSDTYASGTLMGRTKTCIKSIQRGVITCATASGSQTTANATISAVDTTKSMVSFLGATPASTIPSPGHVALTGTTTVTATVESNTGSGTIYVSFEVIEFY